MASRCQPPTLSYLVVIGVHCPFRRGYAERRALTNWTREVPTRADVDEAGGTEHGGQRVPVEQAQAAASPPFDCAADRGWVRLPADDVTKTVLSAKRALAAVGIERESM